MPNTYTIAEARQNLAAIVHELERNPIIELTRRGQPVAVLISKREFDRLSKRKASFFDTYEQFREEYNLDVNGIADSDEIFKRDKTTGRKVEL